MRQQTELDWSFLIDQAKEELRIRTGDKFKYEPLLGNRKPPLDYRNQ